MKSGILFLVLLLFPGWGTLFCQQNTEKYSLSAAELEALVSFLASDEMKGRGNGSPEMEEAARWIEGIFRECGMKAAYPDGEMIRPYSFQTRSGKAIDERNVVGIIEGSDPALKDEYIILSAHYDHVGIRRPVDGDSIYNGADDNAAGTCTLLGITRLFSENGYRPGRSILFACVSGEEMGMRGSRHLANNMPLPPGKAYANINFEMTGRSDDLGPGLYYMTGCSYSNLDETVQAFHMESMHQLIDTVPGTDRLFFMSDNIAFGQIVRDDAGSAGIPCGTFATSVSTHHIHTPKDEAEMFDYGNMAGLVNYLGDMVLWLSHSDRVIEWTDPKFRRIGQEAVQE